MAQTVEKEAQKKLKLAQEYLGAAQDTLQKGSFRATTDQRTTLLN